MGAFLLSVLGADAGLESATKGCVFLGGQGGLLKGTCLTSALDEERAKGTTCYNTRINRAKTDVVGGNEYQS